MGDPRQDWEALLDPDVLRGKLISASVYIAAYDLLTSSIVERIEEFFTTGFDQGKRVRSRQYEQEVLSLNRSPLYASLEWLRSNDVLDDEDLAAFARIKASRNVVAHELTNLLTGDVSAEYLVQFPVMAALLKKIETWWIVNVEIPINPDFAHATIDESRITPGPCIALQLMVDVALGDPETSRKYLEEFRRRWPEEKK